LRWSRAWQTALAALLACGGPEARKAAGTDSVVSLRPPDSLVLTGPAEVEIWFTLARSATGAGGRCVERGLEIRREGRRVQVPLLYTGSPPVLLNDSTMQATLWTHCAPGDHYRVDLRSGHPTRVRSGATP